MHTYFNGYHYCIYSIQNIHEIIPTEQKIEPFRNKLVVIYDNRVVPPELYNSAELLSQYGIKSFALSSGGVSHIHWEIANTDKKFLKELIDQN